MKLTKDGKRGEHYVDDLISENNTQARKILAPDRCDGFWQLVAVVLAGDEHLVVLAPELLHVGLALKSAAHVEHGLQPFRRIKLACALVVIELAQAGAPSD